MQAKQVFEILMREHSQMLLIYLRAAVKAPHLVDEIFQETMLTAWQKLDSFDYSRPFAPWLRGIAKNHLLSHYRKSKREWLMCNDQVLDCLESQLQTLEQLPSDSWSDKIAALKHCIAQLPDKYRQTIEARYIKEQKPIRVRLELAISSEALKKRLQRAKHMLFECLVRKTSMTGEHD